MKLNQLFNIVRACRASLIAAFVMLGLGTAGAANFFDNTISGINLGNASGGNTGGHRNWAIFALSGGVTVTDPIVDAPAEVVGNVGIAYAGNLTLSLAEIHGDVYQDSGGYSNSGGTITGTRFTNQTSYLTTAYNDANAAASAAGSLPTNTGTGASALTFTGAYTSNPSAISLNNIGAQITAPQTVSGNPNSTTYVLNIADLILSGSGAVLTLSGPNTANFVVNVNRYMTLGSQASIALSGGLTPQNVLFNVKPYSTNYDVTLSGASYVNGIILAKDRNVKLTGDSTVYGEVIAKGVSLSGSSQVINPLASP